jgi:hypothetical protein
MLTAMMVAALMNVKAAGIEVNDSLISNGIANLKGQSRGGLIGYGTGNGAPDRAGARGAMLAFALWLGKQTSDGHFGAMKQVLPQAWGRAEQGHAFGPQNFFALALGSYAAGMYGNFAAQWLGKLSIAKNGAVTMHSDGAKDNNFDGGHIADTAVYAIMILLQEKGILEGNGGGSTGGIRPATPNGNSPFSQKNMDKPKDK